MSDAKLAAFRAFDWEGDEAWRAYRANIEIPPGKEALEVKVKAKWYKREVDPDFDVDWVAPPPAAATAGAAASAAAGAARCAAEGVARAAQAAAGAARSAAAAATGQGSSSGAAGGAAPARASPTGELVLLGAHVAMVLTALLSLQPLSRYLAWQAYFMFCRTALVASGYKLYLCCGLPALRPFPAAAAPWMQGVAQSTEFYHFLVATLLLQVPQLWVGMVPLALAAAPPAMATLGVRFGGHPLWARYGRPAKELLNRSQPAIQQASANMEIAMGFQFILVVFSQGIRGGMLAYVYWQNLRMRYWAPQSRPYHVQVWAALGAKAQPLLAMVPALQRYLDYAVRWFQAPGQHRQ
ncbi:hypothetical protein ABPG75_004255 [Micractinium tetrahymenae]